jgi:hypothetical protein
MAISAPHRAPLSPPLQFRSLQKIGTESARALRLYPLSPRAPRATSLSEFRNRRPVNFSDCMSGLGRLRKHGVHMIYTVSGLRRVTPYVQFVLLCYLR